MFPQSSEEDVDVCGHPDLGLRSEFKSSVRAISPLNRGLSFSSSGKHFDEGSYKGEVGSSKNRAFNNLI